MTFRLDLSALTDEEVQTLLGADLALQRLPEFSRARLEGRAVPGPLLPAQLQFLPLAERSWGATPDQSRLLSGLDAEVQRLAQAHGPHYLTAISEARHLRAYTLGPDTAILLRWSETPEPGRGGAPYLQLITWLRDRASGMACVISSGAAQRPAPAPSEEVDYHHHPGAGAAGLIGLHRQHVLRHGKTQKLAPEQGWQRVWQAAYQLNLTAWNRRGALIAVQQNTQNVGV